MMSASATYESTARGGMNGGGVVTTTVGNIGGIIHSNTTSSTVGDALGEFMCYDSGTDAAFNGYVAGGNQQMPAQCALLTTITTPGGGGGVNVGSFVNGVGGGDSSIPSSTSSSHTRIPGLNSHGHYNTDDSGLSSNTSGISDRTTTMLMPMGGGGNVMYGSPDMSYNRNEELTEDLEPMTRDRCNTWPMRRPTLDINAQTSPLIHDRIEEEPFGSNENVNDEDGILSSPTAGNDLGLNDYLNELSPTSPSRHDSGDNRDGGISPPTSQKKSTTRRNAWGNMSYADLITQAILSSPEKRLTLSQVYEWMVQNVPYFRDKGDSNSSAGWKNSIRHNLSLHSRFMRIQNEGAGKSSWWVINPDAKPGRNPRRRASTMEASSKAAIEKKRRGARKRVEMGMRTGTITSGASSMLGSQASIISDLYECDELNSNFDTFRPRTQSNISIPGGVSSRVSPSADANFDEFDFAPWMDSSTPHPQMNELMNRTDQMRLDSQDPPPPYRRLDGIAKSIPPPPQGQLIAVKAECVEVKSDIGIAPPPSYQELNAVNGSMHMQNPLLRNQVQQHQQMPSPLNKPNMAANNVQILQQPPQQQQYFPSNSGGTLYTVQQQTLPPGTWVNTANNQQITIVNSTGNGITQQLPHQQQMVQQQQQAHHQMMCGGQPPMQMHQQHVVVSASTAGIQTSTANLPYDLQNLMPDQSIMDLDMEAVLRHELAQTNNQLSFDL